MINIATITTVDTCNLETEILESDYLNSNSIPSLNWASYLTPQDLFIKLGMIIVPSK